MNKEFGLRVKTMRQRLGVSRKYIAVHAGLTEWQVTRIAGQCDDFLHKSRTVTSRSHTESLTELTMPTDSFVAAQEDFISQARMLVDAAGFPAPPVNPHSLAKLSGIDRIVISRDMQAAGQLVRVGSRFAIHVNGFEPRQRRNFSICHEIAHTFRLRSEGKRRRAATFLELHCLEESKDEVLCDLAAAECALRKSHRIDRSRPKIQREGPECILTQLLVAS